MIQYDTTVPRYKSGSYFKRAGGAASLSCGQLTGCHFIQPEGTLQCTQGPFMKTMHWNLNKFHIPTFYLILISTLPSHLNAKFAKGWVPLRSLADNSKISFMFSTRATIYLPSHFPRLEEHLIFVTFFLSCPNTSHPFALRYPQFMSYPQGENIEFKTSELITQDLGLIMFRNFTRAAPKVMPPIYFHGNYNRYKEHNNAI